MSATSPASLRITDEMVLTAATYIPKDAEIVDVDALMTRARRLLEAVRVDDPLMDEVRKLREIVRDLDNLIAESSRFLGALSVALDPPTATPTETESNADR